MENTKHPDANTSTHLTHIGSAFGTGVVGVAALAVRIVLAVEVAHPGAADVRRELAAEFLGSLILPMDVAVVGADGGNDREDGSDDLHDDTMYYACARKMGSCGQESRKIRLIRKLVLD